MLTLGEVHQLWLVPIFPAQGPHKTYGTAFTDDNSSVWVVPRAPPNNLSSSGKLQSHLIAVPWYVSLIHGNQ